MTWRRRIPWLPAAALAYTALAAARAGGGPLTLVTFAVALGLLAAQAHRLRAAAPREEGAPGTLPRAARAAGWGAAVWAVAASAPAGHPAVEAVGQLGVGVAAVATLLALARVEGPGGLLQAPPAARSLDAAAFTAALWSLSAAVAAARLLLPRGSVAVDPVLVDTTGIAAGVGTLLVHAAATQRFRALRGLELGVGERASGVQILSLVTVAVTLVAAALRVAPADRLTDAAVVGSAFVSLWALTTRDPAQVGHVLRAAVAVLALGGPLVVAAGLAARARPELAGPVLLGAAAAAVGVGLLARTVARPLAREQHRWLTALDAASAAALQPDAEAAQRAALAALGPLSPAPEVRAELWRCTPPEVSWVDLAGYFHVEHAALPDGIVTLALGEPECILRTEVLRRLEVRRGDARAALAWMESRRASSATVVMDADGPVGVLVMPGSSRPRALTLAEARALRTLADRQSALIAVSSALTRSRERELGALARVATLEAENHALGAALKAGTHRHRLSTERLAQGALRAAYGAATRLALDACAAAGGRARLVLLEAPPGVDGVPWAAWAHLSSPRAEGPFIVVEGTHGAEHPVELWRDDARSPWVLAAGGTLVVIEPAALPEETLTELLRRARAASPLETGLILVSSLDREALEEGRRVPAGLLAPDAVALPALSERGDDLRALCLDLLAEEGLRRHGAPLGLEPRALQLLLEHAWPGNERELRATLEAAVRTARGRVLTAEDLVQSGFAPELHSEPLAPSVTPLPVGHRRRRRGAGGH